MSVSMIAPNHIQPEPDMRLRDSQMSDVSPTTAPMRPDRDTATNTVASIRHTDAASQIAVASIADSRSTGPSWDRRRDFRRATPYPTMAGMAMMSQVARSFRLTNGPKGIAFGASGCQYPYSSFGAVACWNSVMTANASPHH